MKIILMVCLLSLSTFCSGQVLTKTKMNSPPVEKVLVADETWIIKSGTTSFRVITSNDQIAHMLMQKFEQNMTKFTYSQKKDRHGTYWERSYYFKNEDWNIVVLFINNLR